MTLQPILQSVRDLAAWIPDWLVSVLALASAIILALAFHRTVLLLLRRLAGAGHAFISTLIARSLILTRFTLVVVAVAAILPVLPLPRDIVALIAQGLVVAFILLAGWGMILAIGLASDFYLRRFNIDIEHNLLARKHLTQVRVLRRVVDTIVIIITVAAALMTIESVRQYGISLIASAGVAGLILGLAARPVLTNLIAGLQIGITQPIRIGDSVIVESEWGWIEEIGSTYVVIKLWDWRRLIVPLSYFLEKPFQNWTRSSSELIGTVLLWVDYTVPVERVRKELEEIVRSSPLWDRRIVNLQVSDASERTIQLRALVSAPTSPQAWDLRCEVREKLIAFLQEKHPGALPRQRAEFMEKTSTDGADHRAASPLS